MGGGALFTLLWYLNCFSLVSKIVVVSFPKTAPYTPSERANSYPERCNKVLFGDYAEELREERKAREERR